MRQYRANIPRSTFASLEMREGDIVKQYRSSATAIQGLRTLKIKEAQIANKSYQESKCSTSLPFLPSNCYQSKISEKSKKIHLDNLRRNLEKRIKIAEKENNQILIAMLEKEFLALHLS